MWKLAQTQLSLVKSGDITTSMGCVAGPVVCHPDFVLVTCWLRFRVCVCVFICCCCVFVCSNKYRCKLGKARIMDCCAETKEGRDEWMDTSRRHRSDRPREYQGQLCRRKHCLIKVWCVCVCVCVFVCLFVCLCTEVVSEYPTTLPVTIM